MLQRITEPINPNSQYVTTFYTGIARGAHRLVLEVKELVALIMLGRQRDGMSRSAGVAQTFASYGGMYNNNANPVPGSQPTNVYFLFSNLADTGGVFGTFSGSFCFSAVENRCSSTVSTAAPGVLMLLGAGLAGLGFARRRRNQPQA
jgi:MYXO-CTERM domain-containing protein